MGRASKPQRDTTRNTKRELATFEDTLEAVRDRVRFNPANVGIFHGGFRRVTRQLDTPGPDMFRVRDFKVPGNPAKLGCAGARDAGQPQAPIPVRLYEPHGPLREVGPTILFIHGGGFVTCDLDSHDGICRRLASGSTLRVLSIGYRLAPACPFPSANEDCETVLDWVLGDRAAEWGIDNTRLAIGGDSAGGTLSTYLAQQHRARFRAHYLFYPLLQMAELKPSTPGLQDRFGIGEVALKFIEEHYVAGADPLDPRLSPLFTDDLAGMPPTYILTCALDPLRFEGQAYAERLQAAGVRVVSDYEKALPHGFLNFARAFKRAKTLPLEVADFLREELEHEP